jgi:hypothetical protein
MVATGFDHYLPADPRRQFRFSRSSSFPNPDLRAAPAGTHTHTRGARPRPTRPAAFANRAIRPPGTLNGKVQEES